MMLKENAPSFAMGRLTAMPAALEAVPRKEIFQALGRCITCDWGDLSDADKRRNDHALKTGGKIAVRIPQSEWHKILDHHGSGPVGNDSSAAGGLLRGHQHEN